MTDDDRGALVDLAAAGALAGAVSVAAYFVLTNPDWRRTSWRLLKYVALTAAPRLVWEETTRAWAQSAAQTPAETEPAIIDA